MPQDSPRWYDSGPARLYGTLAPVVLLLAFSIAVSSFVYPSPPIALAQSDTDEVKWKQRIAILK